MLYPNNRRRSKKPPFLSFFYTKEDKIGKFKQLNQFEYLGLISILEQAFPFIRKRVCGTSSNNLINLLNTITENSPDEDFCMLGAVGVSKDFNIVLKYYDYETEGKSKLYYITYTDAREFDSLGLQQFKSLLKNF